MPTPICTPTTEVVGLGTLAMTYDRQESAVVQVFGGTRTNYADVYTFKAKPSPGWSFAELHIISTIKKTELGGGTFTGTYHFYPNRSPFTSEGLNSGGYAMSYNAVIGDIYGPIGSGSQGEHWQTLSWHVVATFRKMTDLLVNSFKKSLPVQLVYDDRPGGSGLLIADY